MGTRSIIARPTEGGFAGRYCHWDGYPEGVGQAIMEIVARDGVEKACKVLLDDHYSWSGLNSDQPDLAGVEKDYEAPYGSPPYMAYQVGNDINVPGYGISHADSQPDEYLTHDTAEEAWCEWAYVIHAHALTVIKLEGRARSSWTAWEIPWGESIPDIWSKTEALKNYLKGNPL